MTHIAPRLVQGAPQFAPVRLERVFADCFGERYRTLLVGGAPEPLYRPSASEQEPHRVIYREDYFASALHEVAHWCLAGEWRRQQVDYGYWYVGDQRREDQQRAFEAVEYRPQALEWCFSLACGWRFRISADNLGSDGRLPDTRHFCQMILRQARHWAQQGLPDRAALFYTALGEEFGLALPLPEQCLTSEAML